MKATYKTDIGRTRVVNEDSSVIQKDLNGLLLAIIADGMGGHKAGDIASQMAIAAVQDHLQPLHPGLSEQECEDMVQTAIHTANQKLYAMASTHEQFYGMGTTIVVVVAHPEWIVVGHIGDSRAYLYADSTLQQLTEDHSLVNELLKGGQISKEEAAHHPRRNVLIKALGTDPFVEPDIQTKPWHSGNVLLLCSDGLTNQVDEETMIRLLRDKEDLNEIAEQLVSSANEAGGDDNITVVLLANDEEDEGERGGKR